MNVNELRTKRAKAWEDAKNFLDSHRNENGILSDEDTKTYEEMEAKIVNLGKEIERQEKMDAMEREMAMPVNTPITSKPENVKMDEKKGRASDTYKKAFWNAIRSKYGMASNVLSEGVDSEGGYLVPDEFERTLIQSLRGENMFRTRAHVITTSSGTHKIPVVASKGEASWIDENGAYPEDDDTFSQVNIDAHKIGTIIKVSEELLNDSAFDLENYFSGEFARRIGTKEEEAFINGNGSSKPTGILASAELGVTTASDKAITADELIDLFYSLKAPYRKNAVWILNDTTIKAIRKLKDNNGQYLWQPAIKDGDFDTLLGRPLMTSSAMPEIAAGAKAIAFGDLSFYWIGDRQGVTFKRLNERYADMGHVGFLTSKRVDGKLTLPEAIKVLQIKGAAA